VTTLPQGTKHILLIRVTTLREFRCEVCGLVTTNPIHWFVIRCGDSDLTVYRWNSETANSPGARHYCGEAHAEVYIRPLV
jgi:hypothetical protein